eukprot:CAMPEP_0195307732 /NCGR_PEP_ID=MMETSP0707-20130614/37865_1 /TAXON_ID=33640 /ORGANISM="Asterionellopsis glacialis, Strain CCMP134" /LENGTH=30 /DNA_ID= /DNA_START= /DNA_END= /DNA_ORIENTATION=
MTLVEDQAIQQDLGIGKNVIRYQSEICITW